MINNINVTKMKKLVMMVLGALLLASCTNDKEVDIAYQFTVKIDILDVVKGQKVLIIPMSSQVEGLI